MVPDPVGDKLIDGSPGTAVVASARLAGVEGGHLSGVSPQRLQVGMGQVLQDVDLVPDGLQGLQGRLEGEGRALSGGSPLVRVDAQGKECRHKAYGRTGCRIPHRRGGQTRNRLQPGKRQAHPGGPQKCSTILQHERSP